MEHSRLHLNHRGTAISHETVLLPVVGARIASDCFFSPRRRNCRRRRTSCEEPKGQLNGMCKAEAQWKGSAGAICRPNPVHLGPDRAVFKEPSFFFKDRPKGPPTANRQLPPTATNHQSPTTNQPPPTATNRQLPTANRQSPPTANHGPFWEISVTEHFFFPVKDRPGPWTLVQDAGPGPWVQWCV